MNAPFTWTSYARTDVGKVRKLNEDNCIDRGDIGLWVVADGMGGHEAGEVASQMIVDKISTITKQDSMSSLVDEAEDKILETNQTLVEMAAKGGEGHTIGCTVVAMAALKQHCVCMWAGDSRVYRLRGGNCTPLTRDHSQAELMVDRGLLTPEEAETHPSGNMITRAVGAGLDLFIDMDIHEMQDGDRYLICSDGLYKHVTDAEIGALMGQGSDADVVNESIEVTLSRGATDNVTVIVVDIAAA